MKYLSTTTYKEIEIDVTSASVEQLIDVYNSLFDHSYYGDAFPGSTRWKKAKVFSDQLAVLTAARPDVLEYRKSLADAARDVRLANTYCD